jgi:hypothetical protein
MGLREAFLQRAATRKSVAVDIGIGEDAYIRPMAKSTRSKVESLASGNKTAKDCSEIRWLVIRDCVTDSDGKPLLSADDKHVFDSWDDSFIEPIFEKCLQVSAVSDSDRSHFEDDSKN